jgi:broad-specificity NMP kinase
MKLAIYGKSCTGKTTVSNQLGGELGFGARHCGELIKDASINAGCSPGALPVAHHRRIDSATRDVILNAASDLVVEGAFLDRVLADVPGCTLIKLTCSIPERAKRLASRGAAMSVEERDNSDQQLCNELFADAVVAPPTLEVDTTNYTALETARCIMEWLHQRRPGS